MKIRKIRVIVSEMGLDGHDIGAKVISSMLRDAGMEVIYLGKFNKPVAIAKMTLEENADIIVLSCFSPNHVLLIPELLDGLKKNGIERTPVVVGGRVPQPYQAELKAMGVAEIFGPNSDPKRIANVIKFLIAQSKKAGAEYNGGS